MAAIKKIKMVRGPQYERLAEEHGLSIGENLKGYKFKSLTESHTFHFALMDAGIEYAMFDGATQNVKMLVGKENEEAINNLAQSLGATPYKPSILCDYE